MKYKYKAMSWLLVLVALVGFSGCGSENTTSADACKYDIESLLNDESYTAALAKVTTCTELTTTEAAMYNAAAYMGQAGLSLIGLSADITSILSGSDIMAIISSKVSGSASMLNLKNAVAEYDIIIGSANCTTTTDTTILTACSASEVASPMLAVSSLSVLAGEDVTYNGATVSAITVFLDPSSYGIVSGTESALDVDGDGTLDSMQATGMALAYAAAGTTTGITHTYGNVTFSGPSAGPYELIKSTVTGSGAYTGTNPINWHLVNSTLLSTVTTEGYCSSTYVACTEGAVDGSANCYPCPVLDSSGTTTTATEGILDVINSAGSDSPFASVSDMLDCDNDGTASSAELSYYMTNGSCTGYVP